MKEYLRKRQRENKIASVCGVVLAVALHGAAALFVSMHGLTYLWPPSEEYNFVIDFTEPEPPVAKYQKEPVAPKVEKQKPVQVVQKSEAPIPAPVETSTTQQVAQDTFGDVEVPTPEVQEPQLDARASFGGIKKKPSQSTTPVSADAASTFKDGAKSGNSIAAGTDGKPNAHLEGREVLGFIPKPKYERQESGIVTVIVKVDHNGKVVHTAIDPTATTISDSSLIQEARNSAQATKFTPAKADADNPLQTGTITYYFKLQ